MKPNPPLDALFAVIGLALVLTAALAGMMRLMG